MRAHDHHPHSHDHAGHGHGRTGVRPPLMATAVIPAGSLLRMAAAARLAGAIAMIAAIWAGVFWALA